MSNDIAQRAGRAYWREYFPVEAGNGKVEITVRSPFREDNNPSLGINIETGLWTDRTTGESGNIVTFHAQMHNMDTKAAFKDLVKKYGDTPALPQTARVTAKSKEAAPKKEAKQKARPLKKNITYEFVYQDTEGTEAYRYIRYEEEGREKLTLPYHWKDGELVSGLPENKVTFLYRLPELIRDVAKGHTIYVVEGEKCTNAMTERGFSATTNPMGALSWKAQYNSFFAGASVVVIPDNDKPGKAFAQTVAKNLHGIAASVKILELPNLPEDGDDVYDWFARGGTPEELVKLTAEAPEYIPTTEPEEAKNEYGSKLKGDFWYEVTDTKDNPKLKIDKINLLYFLKKQGFCRMEIENETIYLHIQNNIVSEIKRKQIVSFVLNYITELPEKVTESFTQKDLLGTFGGGAKVYLTEDMLLILPVVRLEFLRDTPEESFFFFSNGFVSVKADGIKFRNYEELHTPIWERQIIERSYTPPDNEELEYSEYTNSSVFRQFLIKVCSPMNLEAQRRILDTERYKAFLSAIGYMLSTYKSRPHAKSVIFLEEKMTGANDSNGRTGKGLIFQAIKQLRTSAVLNGKTIDFNNQFHFQKVNLDTQIIFIDDVKKSFDFEHLFSTITEDMNVEKKGMNAFTIPFEESPKIAISTNYVLSGNTDSHRARRFELELSDYFSATHTPFDEFKQQFFSRQWTDTDWNHFYAFMLRACQIYLQSGLAGYSHANLNKRKLLQETNEEFIEFASDLALDTKHFKDEILKRFTEQYPDYGERAKFKLTTYKLTNWLKAFAEANQYKFDAGRDTFGDGGKDKRNWFMFKKS